MAPRLCSLPTALLVVLVAPLVGCVHEGSDFQLVVGLPQAQESLDALEQLFWDVATPDSPEYLHHRSIETLSHFTEAGSEIIAATEEWLKKLGASSTEVSPLRDVVVGRFENHYDAPGISNMKMSGNSVSSRSGSLLWTASGLPHKSNHPYDFDFVLRKELSASQPLLSRGRGGSRSSAQPVGHNHLFEAPDEGYTVENMKKALGVPVDLQASNAASLQMVWGPGTFGYSPAELAEFAREQCPLLNLTRVKFDTKNHGVAGGDNFGEGSLDTRMIASFGLNIETLVSNTNTSTSTEEGNGFGQAFLDFTVELASRKIVPNVLSLSLGSLSAASCDLMCDKAVERGFDRQDCENYFQTQRQVCMYLTQKQVRRINTAMMILGLRGVSIFGSSGDGGSHFSFGPYSGFSKLVDALNEIACEYQFPVYPTGSPYIVSVGGTEWKDGDSSKPIAWSRTGGGFSWQFDMPAHQVQTVTNYLNTAQGLPPGSSFNARGRAYPDISDVAVQGTSQSAPLIAGLFSLLIDHRLNKGLPPLGYVAPRLWKEAEAAASSSIPLMEDVVEGSTNLSCSNGFQSSEGWDPVTGWGRPKWDGLVHYLGSD